MLKHKSVTSVDHVDLDSSVVSVCKKYFSWGSAWDDPRVTLHVSDGARFAAEAPSGQYDVIVQDSSDPHTWDDEGNIVTLPSSILYGRDHFGELHRILRPGGVLNFQAETFNIPSDIDGISKWRSQLLQLGYDSARYGSVYVSSYPTGQIGFMLCRKKVEKEGRADPTAEDVRSRFREMTEAGKETTYYQPKLQDSSFDLPLWVERKVYGEDR